MEIPVANYVSPRRGIRFVLHAVSDLSLSRSLLFGAQGNLGRPFDSSTFDLGVTSRDLSMTLTVFKRILRKWTLAPTLLGLEWCNLGKS